MHTRNKLNNFQIEKCGAEGALNGQNLNNKNVI